MEKDQKELERKVIASISRISKLLTSQAGLDSILKSILQSAIRYLGFSASCLFLLNENQQSLECRMVTGFGRENERKAYKEPFDMVRHDCIETRVVRTGRTIYYADALGDPQATRIDKVLTANLGRGRIVYAPLAVKGKIIGCMGVNRPGGEAPVSESEIEAFTIFANQASIVIENSRASEQLLAERNLKENILNSSPNGVIAVNKKGEIITLNRAACKILSIDHDEVINRSIRNLSIEGGCYEFIEEMVVRPSGATGGTFEIAGENGRRICLEITTSPLRDYAGNITGTTFLIQDVTERKIMSEQVQRMGKLAMVGQLAAGISHEIRNPLMGIGATLELLSAGIDPDDPQRGMLAKSMEEIDRIDGIIGELLNLSRARDMSFHATDINRVISSVADFLSGLCSKSRVALVLDLAESVPKAAIDREKIREAIINICINSLQSMEGGGTLKISTDVFDGNLFNMPRGGIRIDIEDTGKGIPAASMDRVFDPFFTTRPNGTGLGLYNCHKIMEAHGGLIFLENIPSGGTRAEILIPYAKGDEFVKSHDGDDEVKSSRGKARES